MQRILLNGIQNRLAAGSLALAGLLLFTGCAASMQETLEAPVMTPNGGSFNSSQTVTVSDTIPGAALHCTTDGSKPTAASPLCAAPVIVYKSETLSAIAVAVDGTTSSAVSATFTIALPAAAAPVISPAAGTYTAAQTVTISDATTGATIYYTTDGSTPTTASNIYGGPIMVSANETVNAVAVSAATTLSPVASAAFSFNYPAPAPVISPAAGTYTSVQSVTITDAAPGASIFYTLDGSAPTTSSNAYSGPIPLAQSGTFTVNAVAIAPGDSVSAAASAAYTLNLTAAAPVISPAGGTFTSIQTVTITDTTPNAVIHYTTDGSTPTAASPTYSGAITVSAAGATTVSAIAVATGYANSPVATQAFTLNLPAAATPVISPAGGTFTTSQTVTITDTTAGATIYYTLDGVTPTTASSPYTGALTVDASETVEAIAIAPGSSASPAATAVFTFVQPQAATPVISPAGGTFSGAQNVTLSDATTGAAIYYTLDGSTPSTTSTKYTGSAFTVSSTATVKAIATATGYNLSAVASAAFTINVPVGIPLSGVVQTGSTPIPISGASVQMYAAGTSGYGSAPTALLATPVVTSSTGAFSLSYVCPAAPGDQVYLVATGGSVAGTANSSIALMTALGTCSSLTSGASFTINDITTIASAYSLAAFALPASGGGINVGAPAPSATCVSTGANTCNYNGLVNSFKTVGNLVNVTTGAALTITPFYAAAPVAYTNTSSVPQARINTLGNILTSCTQQAAAGGCSTLFAAATPGSGTAPVDTLQTALSIAQNPASNVAGLYTLLPATEAYTPTLDDEAINLGTCLGTPCDPPNDFAIAITYTGGGLGLAPDFVHGFMFNTSMDIDSTGNILVTAYLGYPSGNGVPSGSTGIIAEFNSLGEAQTPATTSYSNLGGVSVAVADNTTGPLSVAVDQAGKIWVDNALHLIELNPDLTYSGVTSGSPDNASYSRDNLTIDALGNIWTANAQDIVEASNTGTVLSPTGGGGTGWSGVSAADPQGFVDVTQLTFDSGGGLWATDNKGYSVYQISTSDGMTKGQIIKNINPPGAVNDGSGSTPTVADGSGNIYACSDPSSPTVNVFNSNSASVASTFTLANGRACGGISMALDGKNNIFALNFSSAAGAEVLDEFTTQGVSISGDGGYSAASPEEGKVLNNLYTAAPVKIDGSGNIWVINGRTGASVATNNVLVEFVGVAAPVVTPLSLALKNTELAARP